MKEYKKYTRQEMSKIAKTQGFLFVETSNGDYFTIAKNDVADFIMQEANRCNHHVNMAMYVPHYDIDVPILTTYGCYLDRIKPKFREEIIDRLIKLQTTNTKPRNIKIFDQKVFEQMSMEEFGEEKGKNLQYDKFFKKYYETEKSEEQDEEMEV